MEPVVGGVQLSALTIAEWNEAIGQAVRTRSRLYVGSQNLHGLYTVHRSPEMREFQRGARIRIDGMPIVLWARVCGFDVRREHRVTWVDWLAPLFSFAEEQGFSICYCGATEAVAETARAEVAQRYPKLRFFHRNGYFAGEDAEREFVAESNARGTDILIVGMGMPRQEQFVLRHQRAIEAPVVLTSGAAIEYLAGAVTTPPRWMGRLGLEWLYRLGENPRRFARRYLVEPWTLVPLFVRDIWHHRVRGGRA